MAIEKAYKKFDLISIHKIPDCNSEGIYLRHRNTGLEVFHLLNSDEENLFAFAFRTPIKNSTGAAHIMEHSVFCGSEKFPLKEPFTTLMNQSVNTFLNALTYSDKTVYPASSMNKKDYFNLMDVYADAVFFPLLKKEAFMQEGHRLELDEKGRFTIQGVVYNEMKGNYSSFESVANDIQLRSLFPDSNYEYDSGGDPLEIPSFTYQDFKNFHKKYYRPENCLLFLYGNISTEEQLDFIQEKLLDRLEKSCVVPELRKSYPFVPEEFIRLENSREITSPIKIKAIAPDTGATGSTVSINWLCGKTSDLQEYVECAFLSEILSGHDGSPLSKVLIESGLGDDIAPLTGAINETRFFIMSFGMHGAGVFSAKKIFSLIERTLSELAEKGIDQKDIDAALMSAEFSTREIVRAGGPYALVLLDRALNGWNYGRNPAEMLYFRSAIEKIRQNVSENPHYVNELINKYLVKNKRRSYVVVKPSKKYLSLRNKKEAKIIKTLAALSDIEQEKKSLKLMHEYQEHHETSAELACMPVLSLSDLKTDVECITTEIKSVSSKEGEIAVFTNEENTNGIVYLSVAFPVDVLPAEDYLYLPLYSYCATNSGWNGKSWAECASDTAVETGGIYTRLLTSSGSKTLAAEKIRRNLAAFNCTDRDWLIFSVRFISEKMLQALSIFSECLSKLDFSDKKRLQTLMGEALSSINSAVIPKGNRFASKRAQCMNSRSGMVDEIWNGLTQLFALNEIDKQRIDSVAEKFEQITKKLFAAGALVHVVADKETLPAVEKSLPDFIADTGLKNLSAPNLPSEDSLRKLLLLPGEKDRVPDKEFFAIKSQVGFSARVFSGSFFGSEKNPAELVLAHWLSGNSLWERIRTSGGAYGAYAASANLSGLFCFSTFRDPNPLRSSQVFADTLEDFAKKLLDSDECVRNITGTYGDEVQPHSPGGRGTAGFFRQLYCISEDDRRKKIEILLKVTPEDLKQAAERILLSENNSRTVIIGAKDSKMTGNIIDLPL